MRSSRRNKKNAGNNGRKKAILSLALGAFMMLGTGFTDGNINDVEMTVDGKTFAIRTNVTTPQEIFAKAGVTLNANDEYVYQKDGNKTKLIVYRAVPLNIEYNGETKTIMTGCQTVGEALNEAGYYTDDFEASVGFNEPVAKDMTVKLNDSAQLIARKQEAEARARETRIETSRGSVRYDDSIYMEATAYLPGDGGGSGITASGIPATYGVAAVDPAVIPLGTRLYIPGYGEAVAADTGGAIVGNKIDLCMEDYGEAMQFGRRGVTVYVLAN